MTYTRVGQVLLELTYTAVSYHIYKHVIFFLTG